MYWNHFFIVRIRLVGDNAKIIGISLIITLPSVAPLQRISGLEKCSGGCNSNTLAQWHMISMRSLDRGGMTR